MADLGDGGHFPASTPFLANQHQTCDIGRLVVGGFSSEVEIFPDRACQAMGPGLLTLEKYTFRMTRSMSSAPASDTPDNLVTTASKPLLVPPSRGHGNGPPLVPYFLFLGLMFCHLPPLHAFFYPL